MVQYFAAAASDFASFVDTARPCKECRAARAVAGGGDPPRTGGVRSTVGGGDGPLLAQRAPHNPERSELPFPRVHPKLPAGFESGGQR